jgi:hypothetical protein
MVYFEAGKSKGIEVSIAPTLKPEILAILGFICLSFALLYLRSRRA